jgi:predicted amidohydrolase YtcJ
MRIRLRIAATALGFAIGCSTAWASPADLVFFNGKIVTVDKSFSIRRAIAVKDGKIIAVGGDELLQRYGAAQRVDLAGRVVMPGFMDTHLHIFTLSHRDVEPATATSIADLQQMVRRKAAELGPGEWITGYGWDEAHLAEKRNPNKHDLDLVAPDNPVVLVRAGGHSSVGNTRALQVAGIDRSTPDPASGLIEHGTDGEPNGIIRERSDLYRMHVPKDRWEDVRSGYIKTLRHLFALGITSFESATTSIDDEPVEQGGIAAPGSELTYRRFRGIAAETPIPRATLYISYPGAARLKAFPHHSGYGDTQVRLGPIGENPVDGGFTGPTAWTLADYKGLPGFRGKGVYSDAELQEMVDTAASLGWQMGLHAIGDAAIQQTVAAYDRALAKYPGADHRGAERRWFLDHFTIMPPDPTMVLMGRDKIYVAQQPNFGYTLEARYDSTMDDWRITHNNSVATPLKKFGIFVAFGSDNLPVDPRVGLYYATTRRGPDGVQHGFAEEAVSRPEAIRMYTANGPYLSWEEHIKGTLEPGKLADMIVLDRDPLTIPDEQLLTMQVDQTYLGGKLVYDRLAP